MLVNGAPATGKSSLARRFAAEHPLALVLDIDEVRAMLGAWLDTPAEAGLLARRLALAMAQVHLSGGRDVLVPQLLPRLGFVEELDGLAAATGSSFVEIALVAADPAGAVERLHRRTARDEDRSHRDAARLVEQHPDLDALLADYHAGVLAVVAARPATHTITTVEGEEDAAYAELLTILSPAAAEETGPDPTP